MNIRRSHAALLLSVLAVEAALITDPIRPWLPFSLWTFEASHVSAAGILSFAGLALVGGLLPLSFPGLRPLPTTFPLIAACLLLYRLPPAAALACATVLLGWWSRGTEGSDAAPGAGAKAHPTLAGLGLGLVVADLSGYALPTEPIERGSLDLAATLVTGALLSAGAVAAAFVARHLAGGAGGRPSRRDWTMTLAAAPAAAALALAAAQAVRIWGVGPVALLLMPPFAVMAPLAVSLSRERRAAAALRRRTDGVLDIIEALALAIEAKDHTSARHLRRMRTLAAGLGRRLGMSEDDLVRLDLAALLHDVGKLAVPEWILSKPGRLTAEEHQKMTAHSETGAGILEAVPYAREAAPLVRHHHEHYDGTGYPAGLAGVEIPLGSRILAVVDAVDSLTSERAYRLAVGKEQALAYIREKAGTLFDPRVAKTLVDNFDALESEAEAPAAASIAFEAEGSGEAAKTRDASRTASALQPPQIQEVLDTIASSHMEIYSLHEIGEALGKALNVEESLSLIAGRLSRLFHFSACAVFVCDRERERLVPRLAAGEGAELLRTLCIPIGSGVSGWAAKEGRSLIVAPPSDPLLKHGARSDLEALAAHPEMAALTSCLVAPLMAEPEVVGVIALYDTAANPYSPAEERLLTMVGRQVGRAVRNGLLFERTQEATLTDALTGLPNTRYMFVAMEQELCRARDTGAPLSILIMDIDSFAQVNEEFGHPAGDRYLIGVSKVIRTLMRDRDTCVRYSGDEFVAILSGVAREEAMHVAGRIRRAVRDFSIEGRSGRRIRTTISLGHATLSLDGETFEEIILVADERLSREKIDRRSRDLAGAAFLPFRRPKQPPHGN